MKNREKQLNLQNIHKRKIHLNKQVGAKILSQKAYTAMLDEKKDTCFSSFNMLAGGKVVKQLYFSLSLRHL